MSTPAMRDRPGGGTDDATAVHAAADLISRALEGAGADPGLLAEIMPGLEREALAHLHANRSADGPPADKPSG
jgi:hypothetical protein